jgi:hypothetical protein
VFCALLGRIQAAQVVKFIRINMEAGPSMATAKSQILRAGIKMIKTLLDILSRHLFTTIFSFFIPCHRAGSLDSATCVPCLPGTYSSVMGTIVQEQ